MCLITFGSLLRNGRKSLELSQKEFARILNLDWTELSKIENDRVEIQSKCYDWLIPILCNLFELNAYWLEQIRQQTVPQKIDFSQGIFPIYYQKDI